MAQKPQIIAVPLPDPGPRPEVPVPDTSRVVKVPIDVHPGIVQGDHSALTVARGAFETLHTGWTALKQAAERVQDSDKLAREARAHTNRVMASLRRQQEACSAACTHLSQKIDAAIQPNPNDPMGGEIRGYIRGADSPFKAAADAAQEGNRRMIAAILNAPPQLSGLTHKEYDTIAQLARDTLEHTDHAALKQLQSLTTKLETYTNRFEQNALKHIRAWETGDDEALKELFKQP